ncbi:MAG: hypothetical protein GY786_23795 [Proteobacteria bacterium]|nr:hypothetical protein [Pseudomonadota bacterium]
MELKDQILQYFDQNPESAPDDFVSLNPDVSLPTVISYWTLWKKMSAWRYSQGLEDENVAKKAPVGKKRKELIDEQKLPKSGLGLANPQIQSETNLKSSHHQQHRETGASIRDLREVELISYLIENQTSLVRIIEQSKIQTMKIPSGDITEGLDEEMMQLFDESCQKAGLTRNQGLNLALRDFIQKSIEI